MLKEDNLARGVFTAATPQKVGFSVP